MSFDKLYNRLENFLDRIEEDGYLSYRQQEILIEMYPELELNDVRVSNEEKGLIFLSQESQKRWIEETGLEYDVKYFHIIKLHDIYVAIYTASSSPVAKKLLRALGYIRGDNT